MNKKRPTSDRVGWTTEALNFFLDFQEDIDNLRISKKDKEEGFAAGTLRNANIICNQIIAKLGVNPGDIMKAWVYKTDFWYSEAAKTNVKEAEPKSNKMETVFGKVGDLYVDHQKTWDNATEVEDIASDDEAEDMDDNEDIDM